MSSIITNLLLCVSVTRTSIILFFSRLALGHTVLGFCDITTKPPQTVVGCHKTTLYGQLVPPLKRFLYLHKVRKGNFRTFGSIPLQCWIPSHCLLCWLFLFFIHEYHLLPHCSANAEKVLFLTTGGRWFTQDFQWRSGDSVVAGCDQIRRMKSANKPAAQCEVMCLLVSEIGLMSRRSHSFIKINRFIK